jgi:hypothetical protein
MTSFPAQGAAAPWGTQLNTAIDERVIPGNVLDYGAAGNGSTDDTAAIQDALDNEPYVWFPTPASYYKITSALLPARVGQKIVGSGIETCVIQQATAGQPIFKFATDLTHSVTVSDLSLEYGSDQSNTGSVAFLYDVAGGSTAGFFHHVYERLHIKSAYRGFGLIETDGGQTLWDATWRNILFEHITNRCVSMVSATPLGIPSLRFFDIAIRNTGSPTISSTGAAFYFSGVNEATMVGLDWEGWCDTLIYADGGSNLHVDGLHVEHHLFTVTNSKMFEFSSTNAEFKNFSWSNEGAGAGGSAAQTGVDTALTIFSLGAASHVKVHTGEYWFTLPAGATAAPVEFVWADPTTDVKIEVEHVTNRGAAAAEGVNLPRVHTVGASDQKAYTAQFLPGGPRALTISGSTYSTSLNFPSRIFQIVKANGTAFTIASPTGGVVGDQIIYDIKNSAGGAMGVVTWGSSGTAFLLAGGTFTRPADTKRRTIGFYNDGTNYVETFRASGDI